MKTFQRLLGGLAAAAVLFVSASPAGAEPKPRAEEWWFSAWGIQHDVWPATRGRGSIVAVLDTGVNASLPELSGVVLRGEDATGHKGDGRRDIDDQYDGHGTSMAALIAGQGRGNTGFLGVAPEAKILPVNVDVKVGDSVGAYEAIAIGIRFAVEHGANVISISQGQQSLSLPNHCDPNVQSAISYALKRDVVIVAAAGNTGNAENWPTLPASCPGVVAVGAIDQALRPWQSTQRQPYIAVSAPGVGGTIGKKGQYFPESFGTSIATALTSGAVALIRSRNPHMSARTVVQRLIATARPIGPGKWNNRTGYGAIQITAAMNPKRYPVPADAPNPVYEAFEKWQKSQSEAFGGGQATPSRSAVPKAADRATKRNGVLPILLGAGGVLVIVAIAVVVVVARRRSRGAMTSTPV